MSLFLLSFLLESSSSFYTSSSLSPTELSTIGRGREGREFGKRLGMAWKAVGKSSPRVMFPRTRKNGKEDVRVNLP